MEAGSPHQSARMYDAGPKFPLHAEIHGVESAPLSVAGDVSPYVNGSESAASSGDARRKHVGETHPPNVHVIHGPGGRIVCVSDIRGHVQRLNEIAAETRASVILHTGDFGFYTQDSIERMGDRTLRHVVQHSPLLSTKLRSVLLDSSDARDTHPPLTNGPVPTTLRQMLADHRREAVLSEFPQLLSGQISLKVPVFTVYGACEDVHIVERVRSGEYQVPNLHLMDESTTHAIDVGSLRLRLLGLGGAIVPHKLFDHGSAPGTMAGGHGTMWTTMLQLGELFESAQHVYDPAEVRILVSYGAPGRDVLIDQLAHAVHADFTISGSLHLRHAMSYNDAGVYGSLEMYRTKMAQSKDRLQDIWHAVRTQVEAAIEPSQRALLTHALHVALHVPSTLASSAPTSKDDAFKNMWHWNLPDAHFGSLVLNVSQGRISSELRSQDLGFMSRRRRGSTPSVKVSLPAPAPPPGRASPPNASAAATLFLGHLGDVHPVTEQEIHAFFGDHARNIVQVHFFPDRDRRGHDKEEPRMRNFVHVTFQSEETAREALESHQGQTIKNTNVVPTLERLERSRTKSRAPPKSEESRGRSRNGRRGRGGRGGRGRNTNAANASEAPPAAAPQASTASE